MQRIFPSKLKAGDEIRIIAPSTSLGRIAESVRQAADARLAEFGLRVSFGKHVNEIDEFGSSSIESRVQDIHQAFSEPDIKAVIPVVGGYNCNQLLRYLDWNLIRKNPKIFCGFSDITALNNAILTKTGLVTYSGPMYAVLGQFYFQYTLDYFRKCLFGNQPFDIQPSQSWNDESWKIDERHRSIVQNDGFWAINKGQATGLILGGNLCTFNLLQGTEYFPDLMNSILFLEDDDESKLADFDRNLQSLIHLPNFSGIRGIVIGRFQQNSKASRELLTGIVKTKRELDNIPVIGNADFGHTKPIFTFPVGGEVELEVSDGNVSLRVKRH